jgi:ABC-2 type transport system ATP-binding protein
MNGISIENLRKTYRRRTRPALDGVTLTIHRGEAFGLIGPNGAGKTTFFGCLLGLLTPSEGSVLIDGEPPDRLSVRRRIGYVPERQEFDGWMTGAEFIAHHHALAEQPKNRRSAEVNQLLDRVGLDAEARNRRIKTYSRGMLQRIGVAQALVGRPRYLFLDEPSSGVDPAGALLLKRLLGELRDEGVTVVLNSHQLDQIEKVCSRVAFIRAGKLESIENLNEERVGARAVKLRLLDTVVSEHLATIARPTRARLEATDGNRAVFIVEDDRMCADLIAALAQSGMAVVEAVPAENRLERFFSSERLGALA